MLKISQIGAVNHSATLRLEGRVVGPWVAELGRACEKLLAEKRTLSLHLPEVEYLDAHGVTLLRDLRSRGVIFLECPLFVVEQLKAAEGSA